MAAPRTAVGKADVAPPQVDAGATNRHDAAAGDGEKKPLLEDVMQLARLGDVPAVKRLFDNGTVTSDFHDEENITPLHWAAINNHYAMCKFLIEMGCRVNAKGGEAVATAIQWAAQRCNYYIVWLLLQHGADPLITDASGYNTLHLATFDGNVFLITLLLHQSIPIDVPDPQGHTCLMWAAYKGYPAVVDLFLRWGASVEAVDDNGFTALHWALVKGSTPCVQKLLEYGADRFATTNDGKTPDTVATEMKTRFAWLRALRECGYDEEGHTKQMPFLIGPLIRDRQMLSRFLFLYPFLLIPIALYILSGMPVFVGIPMTFLFLFTANYALKNLLNAGPADMRHVHKTPFLSGVFAGTLFWVGARWVTRILRDTFSDHPFLNFIFGVLFISCTYFYAMAMTGDPGFVPKAAGRSQQKATIEELLDLWKFDEDNFCPTCMIRTPLRSKHCRRCKRCVAKHDHHCPWIHNCVGVNNLRQFLIYIISMEFGVIVFLRLVFYHLNELPAPPNPQCNVLSEEICSVILRDPFTVVLSIWAAFQLTWVSMLVFVQLLQISRATTTYENMHGHSNASPPSGAAGAVTAALTAGATSMDGAALNPNDGGGHGYRNPHGNGHGYEHRGCWAQWKKLLGVDTFVATAFGEGRASDRSAAARNPYSRGCMTNCSDFWLDGGAPLFGRAAPGDVGQATLGGQRVDYTRMYESPRMTMTRRPQRDRDNDGSGGGGGSDAVYQNISAEEEGI